jgi:hypothetical protein
MGQARVKKRLAAEKADVSNIPLVQDVQSAPEQVRIDPAQIFLRHFAIRKIAEIARGVAGVRHRDIA